MEVEEIISSGLLELYVMGITSPEETRDVEQWAKQYPEVAAEIGAIASAMESYAQANAVQPAASVKEKVFARINQDTTSMTSERSSTAKVYAISSAWKYAAAAGIILLVGSLIFNYSYYNKYKNANDDLQLAQNELRQQKELAQSMDTAMHVMGDKYARPIALMSTDTAADMAARIYWMKNTNEVFIDPSNLPKAPEGKQYEFWGIVDGKPVNGGVITTEINGKTIHIQRMASFGKAQAFAISLEDAGPPKARPAIVKAAGNI